MSYVTKSEMAEIMPDLRAMSLRETSADVLDALERLIERYREAGDDWETPSRVTMEYAFMA